MKITTQVNICTENGRATVRLIITDWPPSWIEDIFIDTCNEYFKESRTNIFRHITNEKYILDIDEETPSCRCEYGFPTHEGNTSKDEREYIEDILEMFFKHFQQQVRKEMYRAKEIKKYNRIITTNPEDQNDAG